MMLDNYIVRENNYPNYSGLPAIFKILGIAIKLKKFPTCTVPSYPHQI